MIVSTDFSDIFLTVCKCNSEKVHLKSWLPQTVVTSFFFPPELYNEESVKASVRFLVLGGWVQGEK